MNSFQCLDGSFLEDIEGHEQRAPRDIDVLTVYWGYDKDFMIGLAQRFPDLGNRSLSKTNFSVDSLTINASLHPQAVLQLTGFWMALFSHTRTKIWKGMLKVEVNTPEDDQQARNLLNGVNL